MPRRQDRTERTNRRSAEEQNVSSPRVLIVATQKEQHEALAEAFTEAECVAVSDSTLALEHAQKRAFDAVYIHTEHAEGCPYGSAGSLLETDPALAVVMVSPNPDLDEATRAMRAGCVDIVCSSGDAETFRESLARATEHTAAKRAEQRRIGHLQGLCKQLNSARQEVTRHVGSLCDDLVSAYDDLNGKLGTVTLASEFDSVVRQELDIEDLLRTVLEFILAKIGPLNAGVFLPSTSGDYTLGAYVNYDCPKDAAEVMLDHLADTLPHAFEDEPGLNIADTDDEMDLRLGHEAHWLADKTLLVYTCCDEDEVLGVIALFKARTAVFTPEQRAAFATIAELFGKQLGRVIRTHHRHLPRDQWGALGDPDDGLDGFDGLDLAA